MAWGNASAPAQAVKSNPPLPGILTAARPSTAASCPLCCRGSKTMLAFTKGMCSSILVFHPRTQAAGKSQGRPSHQKWALTQMKGVAIRCLKSNSSVVKAATSTILETPHCPPFALIPKIPLRSKVKTCFLLLGGEYRCNISISSTSFKAIS